MNRRKNIFLCSIMILSMIVTLTACADNKDGQEQNQLQAMTPEQEKSGNLASDNAEKQSEQTETASNTDEEEQLTLPGVEVSNHAATVYYAGEEFTKSVFATGGGMLYMYGIKSDGTCFLGSMKAEEDVFQEIETAMPDDMRVINMYVDEGGNCHTLWLKVENLADGMNKMLFEEGYILKVNKEGKTEYCLDVSELIREKQKHFYCFFADREGNYYFENNRDAEIIKLKADGSLEQSISCEGYIAAIGSGRSGIVYCVYENEDGVEILSRIIEGTISSEGIKLPHHNTGYSRIEEGTDTEVLMCSLSGGVYTYDEGEGEVVQRIKGSELPIQDEDISGHGFVGDGRLCLLGYEDGKMVFYYIPAGQ